MIMPTEAITIIGAITTLLGGMWLMFERQQKGFLKHLELKNGYMERMDIRHQESNLEVLEAVRELRNQIELANTNYLNIQSVLNDSARALHDHHKEPCCKKV